MVAATGDIYYGLWYPVVVAAITFVVGLLFVRAVTRGMSGFACARRTWRATATRCAAHPGAAALRIRHRTQPAPDEAVGGEHLAVAVERIARARRTIPDRRRHGRRALGWVVV